MYYWHKESDPLDEIVPLTVANIIGESDIVTVYAMDKTIAAIQKKIVRRSKYCPDDRCVVKKKSGAKFYLHGIYQMIDGKLRRVS